MADWRELHGKLVLFRFVALLAHGRKIVDLRSATGTHFDEAQPAIATVRAHLKIHEHLRHQTARGRFSVNATQAVAKDVTIECENEVFMFGDELSPQLGQSDYLPSLRPTLNASAVFLHPKSALEPRAKDGKVRGLFTQTFSDISYL